MTPSQFLFKPADDARCPFGGGHTWQETGETWRDGRPVQVLKCSKCGRESVGYLEDILGYPVPEGVTE